MVNEKERGLRTVLSQISSIDHVVALDIVALESCLIRVEASIARAAAAAAAAQSPNKIAIVPVYGALTPRGGWFGTGFDSVRSQVRRAASDSDVGAIVLDVDSPGGTVAGTMETAAEIRAAAAQKPVVAIANTIMGSAAYWLGSQASELVIAPSADVGSIGAMIMHVDLSQALSEAGVNISIIRSEQSPLKNEAHPFAPLSDEARGFLQGRANDAGAEFIKAVAGGRKTTQANVRENFGQGRMLGAREAVNRGMGDRVATLEDVIGGLAQRLQSKSRRRSALAFE